MPRRSVSDYDKSFAAALSETLRRAGSDFTLRTKQAAMLVEAVESEGLFGMVGTGEGKSYCAPLFGLVMDATPVVLLVPAQIKNEILTRVIPHLRKHIDFVAPHVVSYSELSTASKGDILDRIKPALIVCDEVHNLKAKSAARTKRFVRYFADNPTTLLVALSGTIARRSLMDFWHIIQLTHRGWRMPVTRHWREAKDWSLALDPQVPPEQRLMPGSLLELCSPGEDLRDGFRRRLLDTEGVVGGSAEEVGASLVIRKLSLVVPDCVLGALAVLRKKWETPAGECITDALDYARKARELAQGFYYVWDWPRGEPDEEWLFARAEWRKAVAEVCKLSRQGLDSELLVRNAAEREQLGTAKNEDARLPKTQRAKVAAAWGLWQKVKDRAEPETRAVWLDDFVVRAALRWARENKDDGGIIWYDARAIEERAAALAPTVGALVCGAGNDGNTRLLALAEGRTGVAPVVFASAHAHGTGKNLQRWHRALVLAPWSGAADWEQRVARLHRPGQEADEVTIDVFVHTPELEKSISGALEQAKFLEGMTGGVQKILQATWLGGFTNTPDGGNKLAAANG